MGEEFTIRPFSREEAESTARWRYDGELAIYNGEPEDVGLFLARPPDGTGYFAIVRTDGEDDEDGEDYEDDEIVGFCCFGVEAMVAGQRPPRGHMVDVGISIRPDLLGQGIGTAVLPAVLEFAAARLGAASFRAAIGTFNERSVRLFRRHGFRTERILPSRGDIRFVEVVRHTSAERGEPG